MLDRADTTTDDRERARFVLQLFTETFAPTNSLLGNPGALAAHHRNARQEPDVGPAELHRRPDQQLRHAAPGGRAEVPGGQQPRDDSRRGGVSRRRCSNSSSTRRRPTSCRSVRCSSCRRRSTSSTPPTSRPAAASPSTRFSRAIQTFAISWRNPTAAQRDWNMETYLTACKEAVTVACDITGADKVNAMAACAGGFTLATLLGHLAAKGEARVASATLLVTVLDTSAQTLLGQFASRTGVACDHREVTARRVCSKAARWRACSPGCGPTTSCGCSSPTTG